MRLSGAIERWPVRSAFVIARGVKTHVDVVVATVEAGGLIAQGECTPIYYHGETAENVLVQIAAAAPALAAGADRAAIQHLLPRGAARNAIDAALWRLEATRAGIPIWRMAGLPKPHAVVSAFTISLADPAQMEADARAAALAGYPLLKVKLAGEGDGERVSAVRRGAPSARLIVDANESWTDRDVVAEAAALLPHRVELIEQPVRAGCDAQLDGVDAPIPFCADESCQDRSDLARCHGRYQAINIKLDKAGGLTEAIALVAEARAAGFKLMIGCMLSTSLGIAPAALLAGDADWVDLDGALLLARDRPDGISFDRGRLLPQHAEA